MDLKVNKREAEILRLLREQSADKLRLDHLMVRRLGRTGRHSEPMRDLMIYHLVSVARLLKRPKHPGLPPVPLSWDKAYEVASRELSKKDEREVVISFPMSDGTVERVTTSLKGLGSAYGMTYKNLSNGAIRAAYAKGKKIAEVIQRIGKRSNQIKALSEKSAKKS
jgi:hypothetical protein